MGGGVRVNPFTSAARPLHMCPAGCCGPTPCFSRETSLLKAEMYITRFILARTMPPAKNKWTKLHPAFMMVLLQVALYGLITAALEDKTNTRFFVLKASAFGQAHNADPDDDALDAGAPMQKGQTARYSKRTLLFYGDWESLRRLLIWATVGPAVMHVHYHFFRHTYFLQPSQVE